MHRNLRAAQPVIVRGQGNFFIDDKGKRHLAALGWSAGSDLWLGHADQR
ncbi:hypothetical protein OIHEL45_01950 [Sulfitobacter indolifex HEL-45]|uniref:Uncharacterized protein n=1 Tax=Sulfitobacter indolifex HEL-45 TaxID=391624 RepID=A0ABP2DBA3_9RHOB|nr:hypothetical protein OIHEL45_01950 [Sulfitobacter indolifex HEL-45]